jgi:hypothetical protein
MSKASFTLSNGTVVMIEGTLDEIKDLISFYEGAKGKKPFVSQRPSGGKSEKVQSDSKKNQSDKGDISKIVDLIKTCPEAKAIETNILDETNELNRSLIPIYIVHEYLDNAFGLTTSEISQVTIGLSAKVSRQNVLRAMKFYAVGLVIKDGNPSRYKMHRKGLAHIRRVLSNDKTAPVTAKRTKKKKKTQKAQESPIVRGAPKNIKPAKTKKSVKGPQTYILGLIQNGFFAEKRFIGDVQKKLEELGQIYAQTSLSAPLLRLVRSEKLSRLKENDAWYYIINKS